MQDDYGVQKRAYRRVGYRDPVQVSVIGHPAQRWALLAEDLSELGLMLLSPTLFPVQTRLLMEIDPAADPADPQAQGGQEPFSVPVRAVGVVRWVARAAHQERYRLGVQLEELSQADRQRLRELVVARDGEAASP
ncbi:hypothetical protein F2Q65_07910 [Thiohalocapsa marina]|uniref:PilZ domain-containing protein n=1 Tax=Thiohalocapsa marina TaxID=424902 RepID=A0A5M8FNN6_9GAMM|nr:PilZ domain-containing protein [Thiohalocapsa marina]KAA6185610.1 hypothetical protein F2Q65_07910 [Thiohalocapsa marina]